MDGWLITNVALAGLELAGYAAAGWAILRSGGDRHRRWFAVWWLTSALAMANAIALASARWWTDPTVAGVKASIILTLVLSAIGVAFLVAFFWHLLRGNDRGWVFAPIIAIVVLVSITALWNATATEELTQFGTALNYGEAGPPGGLFVQSVLTLVALGFAIALYPVAARAEGTIGTRLRLVASAAVVFYVSKAAAGALISTGFAEPVLIITRLMGMVAAGLGYYAYWAQGTLAQKDGE